MALSKEDKLILTTGVLGVVTIGAIAYALRDDEPKKTTKKNYGIKVDEQCNNFTVTNEAQIRDTLRAEIRSLAKRGSVDPFEAARAFLKKAAPHCTTYPNNTRNPGEAALFVQTLNSTLDVMEDEKLVSEDQIDTFKGMVYVWAVNQGVPPGDF